MIPALEQQPFQKIGPWLDLASQLYREQAFPEALAIFQQIVRQEPQHYQASLKLARTHLRLYEVDIAGQILTELSCDPQDREFSTVMADYHTMVGEYSEAIAIAKRRLRQDETDLEALILLGNAYQASGQLLFAGAVYQSALAHCVVPDQEQRREILRLLAGNHFLSRRFDQAAQILEALLQEQPTDIASRILLVENWLEAKNFPAAEELTCSAEKLTSARDRFALRTQYAYVLLEQGRFGEALNEFQTLAADPSGCVPDVAYGFYRSAKKLKQPESVREALALGPSPIAPAAVWGVGFADRALSYCDCCSAAAVLDDALCHAPKNLVLLIRRGEAAQQCDCDCSSLTCESCFPKIAHIFGDSDAVPPPAGDQWFSQALPLSPTNIRARLGLARVLSQHLEYDAAYAEYLNLMKFMPQDINIAREAARMVAGWQGIERAGGLYERADVAAGGEVVGVSREMPSEEGFGVRQLVGAGPGEVEVPVSELLDTEHRAKYLRGWRFRKAIPFYESLIDQEPTNEEALFDLAQTYSALNRTQCAIDTYRRLLEINPCHQDAATALVRNELELRPKLIGTFDFQNQVGRQGLANITWENYSVSERQTLGDENEYFEWGYTQRVLHPTDGADDVGQVPFLHWQEKFYNDNYFFLDLAVEQYQYGMDTRPTFNTGFRLNSDEDAELGVSGFLKNYYANGEAILQDIYWGGIQIDGVVRPLRLWTLSGYYRATAFSDHNAANWFNINSAHMLIQGRRQLRGIIDYDFYSFANQTIFGPIPGNLAGTIHPYWAPSGYSFVTTGLEWKHWLSCDTFKGGNEHWYMLYFAGAVDSNGQGYFVFNSRWQRDLANWMTWNIDVNLTRSQKQVYDAVGVLASLVIRIP